MLQVLVHSEWHREAVCVRVENQDDEQDNWKNRQVQSCLNSMFITNEKDTEELKQKQN